MACDTIDSTDMTDCGRLYDEREFAASPSRLWATVQRAPGGGTSFCDYSGSCAINGCVDRAWYRFDLASSTAISQFRFMAGWWNERPDHYEIWVSDDPVDTPNNGANLVYAGVADGKPWRCVAGEPCTAEVPDECCPNGRDQPQDPTVLNLGTFWPKWSGGKFTLTAGRYWYFVVVDSDQDYETYLDEAQFLTGTCQ